MFLFLARSSYWNYTRKIALVVEYIICVTLTFLSFTRVFGRKIFKLGDFNYLVIYP